MEFETLKKSHKKEIIIGVSIIILIGVVLIIKSTFAKYKLVKNIKIAEGTINYKVPDFKIMAIYKNDGNGDVEIETMPESGYALNEDKSYCNINDKKDSNAKLYTDEDGQHIISKITKGSRCYLYFEIAPRDIKPEIIAQAKSGKPDFSKVATTDEGVYTTQDNDGVSYYFRGSVENNYVNFGKNKEDKDIYWRIIRINGDGTIRLIYDGTEAHANGTSTSDSIAVSDVKWSHKDATEAPNYDYSNDNAYVGFQYTLGELRGLEIKSNALLELETWYQNNLASYAPKIDTSAGFCGDRTAYLDEAGTKLGGGIEKTRTHYGALIRLYKDASTANAAPALTCVNANDLYTVTSSTKGSKSLTYPIGLISADEVAMAGGVWGTTNRNYYLYNGQVYMTLSPYYFNGSYDSIFHVNTNGIILGGRMDLLRGLRPVINLRSDTKFIGTGTMSNPYVVVN